MVRHAAIFILFAIRFFKPATTRDGRHFGVFSAFVVALFVEMYGFPLTLCLLSGGLATRFPGLDLLTHDSGHLWSTLLGEAGDPQFGVLHLASYVFLGYGFCLLADLSDDLAQSATVTTDDGRTFMPTGWRGAPPGGHHREGVLVFDAPAPLPSAMELRIDRPGESVPRDRRRLSVP